MGLVPFTLILTQVIAAFIAPCVGSIRDGSREPDKTPTHLPNVRYFGLGSVRRESSPNRLSSMFQRHVHISLFWRSRRQTDPRSAIFGQSVTFTRNAVTLVGIHTLMHEWPEKEYEPRVGMNSTYRNEPHLMVGRDIQSVDWCLSHVL